MNASKKEMIEWEIEDCEKHLEDFLKRAQQKAAAFTQCTTTSSALWELESIGQSMQQLAAQAKEYTAKVEVLKMMKALIED